jgi:hypothetical protein
MPPRHPNLTAAELAAVLNDVRELWKDSDEAPAVRSAVGYLAQALHGKYGQRFGTESFWRACGYEWVPL